MREILFRGKRIDNGEWVEGHFYTQVYTPETIEEEWYWFIKPIGGKSWENFRVDPKTVGQYTGLTDKNGKKIFEGDIVHILGNQEVEDWKHVNYVALIAFIDGAFCALDGTIEEHGFRRYGLCRMDFDLEVIGNIHDNPGLLGGEENAAD